MAPQQTNRSSSRKRTRPQPDAESSSAPTPDINAAVKRRRLNAFANSSPSTPKGLSAITSAIGGYLGFGRGASAASRTPSKKPDGDSVYDFPGSSSADEAIQELQSLPIKHRKLGIRYPAKKTTPSKNVYAVPDSGSEGKTSGEEETDGVEEDQQMTPSRRGRGDDGLRMSSRRRNPTERVLSHIAEQGDAARDTANGEEPLPKRRGRPLKSLEKAHNPISRSPAIKKAKLPAALMRGSPRTEVPKLKGILTPQKKRPGRPRKNVAFDGDECEKEPEVFFEDLPTKVKSSEKAKGQQAKPIAKVIETHKEAGGEEEDRGEDDDEDEDDEVCAICSKPDSKPPNEIIFCENCDMAVHQKCYNVPVIPEGDWICRNCSQEDVVSGTKPTPKKPAIITKRTIETPNIPNFEEHFHVMQRVLLDRCAGNRRIKLRGQPEAYDKAYQLIEQTVSAGEGNSMMIIGARGCGKTTMVEEIISSLKSEHLEEFHVVRLNGFIHTDDKLALKEIWRQIGKEMDIEEDATNKTNNYADTMASLLALLSHPTEITGTEEGVTSKAVVFIIDEFDLFATHARQTLLYNLFDIAQARKAPIAVLGLTTRIDVVESLEKRVKSRFSHRNAYLSLPKTLQSYWDICKQGLSVDEQDLESEGFDVSLGGLDEFREYWDEKIEVSIVARIEVETLADTHFQALRKTPAFEDHLDYHYYTSKSVVAFFNSCILPLSAISPSSLELSVPSSGEVAGCVTLEPVESKLHLLAALSDLELSLLISAARLDIVAHTDTVNFAMAYDEYSSQMGKQRVQSATSGMLALGGGARVWGRGVASVAWERLITLGLLLPSGIGGRSNAAYGGLEGRMWKLDVALEEIPYAVALPGFLAKWCSQI
ncbi:origin recognition complex subunit 4 C-terminus-domain-containing protein [Xylariomycetidae sp. FL2044]|nr:origin recognition complex subunit 4 C-terminus-domain-containing protein [Xylariomycetidae sp. FL2044]